MKYEYTYVPTYMVAENIEEYIIPECQEACRSFWNKNIMTFMCSNYNELSDQKYVMINKLSDQNKEKFEALIQKDPEHYYFSKYRNAYGIRVDSKDAQKVSQQLNDLTKPFEMQDIYEGKMSEENFLMDIVGLVTYRENPELEEFSKTHTLPKMEEYDDALVFLDALEEYENAKPSIYIREVDKEKVTKSFKEYVEEYGYQDLYDSENNIVYKHSFYKNAHQRYLDYIAQNKRPTETGLSYERIEEGAFSINKSELKESSKENNGPVQE